MDGYHLYKRELDQMDNSEYHYLRRGSSWTFAPKKLLNDLKLLKIKGHMTFPSFDHK